MDLSLAQPILGTAYAFIVLCTIAILLRFTARYVTKAFGYDDWMVLAAYIIFLVTIGLEIRGILAFRRGPLDPDFPNFFKYMYIYGAFYFLCVALLNMAILLLYRRIFPTPWFDKITMILIILNVLWVIPCIVVSIWTCSPPESFWKEKAPKCIDYGIFWLIMAIVELLIQIGLMLMPLIELRKLQLTFLKKSSLSIIFLLGNLAIISQIVRIALSYTGNVKLIGLDKDALWLNVHLGVAIISTCLPTYKPLITLSTNKLKSAYSYVTGSSTGGSNGSSGTYVGSASDGQKGSGHSGKKKGGWQDLDTLEAQLGQSDDIRLVERTGQGATT